MLALILATSGFSYAKTVSQRVGTLEKKSANYEKRLSSLEKNLGNQAEKKQAVNPKSPIIAYFISSVTKNVGDKMGVVVTLVVENGNAKPVYAFSGDFVFYTSDGKPFFKYPYIQTDPLYGYKRGRVLIPVDSASFPKAYLRFVKDKNITVRLLNQAIY